MFRRHLNFRQILIGYIEFCQSLFSRSERLTNYALKYDNFKSVEVQGWAPLKILIFILHWTLRPTFTTVLGKCRAISDWMAVPKNRGKCKSATISLHRGDSLSMSCIVCFNSTRQFQISDRDDQTETENEVWGLSNSDCNPPPTPHEGRIKKGVSIPEKWEIWANSYAKYNLFQDWG